MKCQPIKARDRVVFNDKDHILEGIVQHVLDGNMLMVASNGINYNVPIESAYKIVYEYVKQENQDVENSE